MLEVNVFILMNFRGESIRLIPHPAGGILAALPIISVLSLSFLYYEPGGNTEQVGTLSFSIGWFVLSLGLFLLLLPTLLRKGISFSLALGICFVMLIVMDAILVYALRKVS